MYRSSAVGVQMSTFPVTNSADFSAEGESRGLRRIVISMDRKELKHPAQVTFIEEPCLRKS